MRRAASAARYPAWAGVRRFAGSELALFSLTVGIALVSYYFWKAGRLLVRSNIAILTIMLAICIMMLVQGVGFFRAHFRSLRPVSIAHSRIEPA